MKVENYTLLACTVKAIYLENFQMSKKPDKVFGLSLGLI